jgi:methionyl-tRNA formyltransferase
LPGAERRRDGVIRVVFFGSSDSVFSNRHFGSLLESGAHVAAVVDVPTSRRVSTNVSRRDGASFLELAEARGIPRFEPVRTGDPQFVESIQALEPDVLLAVGYLLFLGPSLRSVPRVVAANFHASLLPAYRGKHPVFWALRNGEPWCGLTVHEMAAGLDTGPIIFQVRVAVRPSDSVSALYERIMAESVPLVSRLVEAAATGSLPRTPQPEEGASYFGATTEADFRIDWSMKPAQIARWVTATPGQCFVNLRGQRVFLMDAAAVPGTPGSRPGDLLRLDPGACLVAASGGAVEILRVRGGDGAVKGARDLLLSMGLAEGAALGGA